MKALKKLFIFLLVVAGLAALISQALPDHYLIQRSIIIDAMPPAIYPWISDLKRWPEWTVWNKTGDPTLEYTYEGPEEGVGAISKWDGKKFGQGQMTVTESSPTNGVFFDLSFDQGQFLCKSGLKFSPAGFSTKLIWSMEGDISRNPIHRWYGLFIEKQTAPDLEKGLANLKAKVEAEVEQARKAAKAAPAAQ